MRSLVRPAGRRGSYSAFSFRGIVICAPLASATTLVGLLDGIELVGTASDGEQACALAAEHEPQVVLM